MDKKKIQLIITGGLILVFLLISVDSAKTIAKKKQLASGYEVLKSEATVGTPALIQQKIIKNIENVVEESLVNVIGRDPFKRQSAAEDIMFDKKKNIEGIDGVILTGIAYNKQSAEAGYCIINGEMLKLKDKIGDFMVTDIKENQVNLLNEKEQKEYKLKLWED